MKKVKFDEYVDAVSATYYKEFGGGEQSYEVGKTYNYTYETESPKKVKYLGTVVENHIRPNSTDVGDTSFEKPFYLFEWLEGEGSISSHGVKGHTIGLGKKVARKRISEIE